MRNSIHVLGRGTSFETEYYMIQADKEGPTCMVTAGLHGNEIAAPLAAKRIQGIQLKRGTLVLVPVVNKLAYRNQVRGNPDMNRMFPSRAGQAPHHPLAKHILNVAGTLRPVMCLDLHEGWGFHQLSKDAFGQTLITHTTSTRMPLIHRVIDRMNASIRNRIHQFTIRYSSLPGSLRTAMTRILGIPTVTVETAISLPLWLRINYQEKIVRHFLSEIGFM